MPPSKFLSKEDILRAMQNTKSNHGAARFLRCSLNHYKKFAKVYIDEATGLSLNELHKNPSGKGIPKFLSNKGKKAPLKARKYRAYVLQLFIPICNLSNI